MSTPPVDPAAPSTTHEIPVCPRHPQTAAYTRCQRCGHPACPRCQVPASVGFQCVDCVVQEKRANPMPAQRSELGVEGQAGRPYITMAIIGLCIAVWVGELLSLTFFGKVAFVPLVAKDEPWRFITSGFAHDRSSPIHLLFNMMALYYMGRYLEPMLGRVRFAAVYLLSVLGGSVGFELLTSPPSPGGDFYTSVWATPLVGASGGVFGLFLAIVVFNRHLGRDVGSMMTLIGINVVIGFMVPNVAWQAHLGGALTGAVAAGLVYALRRRPNVVQYAVLGALGAILFAVAYWCFASADTSWIQIIG